MPNSFLGTGWKFSSLIQYPERYAVDMTSDEADIQLSLQITYPRLRVNA